MGQVVDDGTSLIGLISCCTAVRVHGNEMQFLLVNDCVLLNAISRYTLATKPPLLVAGVQYFRQFCVDYSNDFYWLFDLVIVFFWIVDCFPLDVS